MLLIESVRDALHVEPLGATSRSRPARRRLGEGPCASAQGASRTLSLSSKPTPVVAFPCRSRSTRSTRLPMSTRAAPRLVAVVLLPDPPLYIITAYFLATYVMSCN